MIEFIKNSIQTALQNDFFQGGALLGVLAWIGMQLKNVPELIWDRIKRRFEYVLYIDNTSQMYDAFSSWYLDKYPESFKRVEAILNVENENGEQKYSVDKRQYNDFNFVRYNNWWVYIKKEKDQLQGATSQSNRYVEKYIISSIFGKNVIEKMTNDAVDFYIKNKVKKNGIRVFMKSHWGDPEVKYLEVYKKLENIFFEGKDELISDIKNFLSKKDTYKKNAIRFKRGYLLYGPGGTGKTITVFAIADYLGMPVFYINPKDFSTDGGFEDYVQSIPKGSLVLIEDVDIFWTNREEKGDTNVSFQSLLNTLDGFRSPSEVLIFMTSNAIEDFDEAFLRRGRLDYKVYIGYPKKEYVEMFLRNFYDLDNVVLSEHYIDDIPMVDIQDLCIKNNLDFVINFLNNK